MNNPKKLSLAGVSLFLVLVFGASRFWGGEETGGPQVIKGAKIYTSASRGVLSERG